MRRFLIAFLLGVFCVSGVHSDESTLDKITRAQNQVKDLEDLLHAGDPQPLQWNRYVTNNFEILSLDDAQGKYLYNNMEFIKLWTLWRWGMKDVDFPVKCKVIAVPSSDLYSKLFNRKNPSWRVDLKDDKVNGIIWIITDDPKWNTSIPMQLTEVILANFEVKYGTKLPIWCHRGMTILNSRFSEIRATFSVQVDAKFVLETTSEIYAQMDENQRSAYDAQAAVLCLWIHQENNGKVFLDFLSAAMGNPQTSLQIIKSVGYDDLNQKIKSYQQKLSTAPDYYLTW